MFGLLLTHKVEAAWHVSRNQDYILQYTKRHAITFSNVAGPQVRACLSGEGVCHLEPRNLCCQQLMCIRRSQRACGIRVIACQRSGVSGGWYECDG